MTAEELKDLLERVQAWPKAAQDELMAIAEQIENELRGGTYVATRDELLAIDAIASTDADFATDGEVEAVLAKFRSK